MLSDPYFSTTANKKDKNAEEFMLKSENKDQIRRTAGTEGSRGAGLGQHKTKLVH